MTIRDEEAGRRFKTARRLRTMTQATLAETSGVGERTIRKLEHGEAVAMETVMAIRAVLEASSDDLPAPSVDASRSTAWTIDPAHILEDPRMRPRTVRILARWLVFRLAFVAPLFVVAAFVDLTFFGLAALASLPFAVTQILKSMFDDKDPQLDLRYHLMDLGWTLLFSGISIDTIMEKPGHEAAGLLLFAIGSISALSAGASLLTITYIEFGTSWKTMAMFPIWGPKALLTGLWSYLTHYAKRICCDLRVSF